jgi:hypothetical protein
MSRQVIDRYQVLRALKFGVMDAIRMTAKSEGLTAWDVAELLGLSNYFISNSIGA